MSKGSFSVKMLISSIIFGLIYGFIGEVVYVYFHILDKCPRPVVTAVYFGGLFVFFGLGMALSSKLLYSHSRGKVQFSKIVILFLIMIVASLLFEFLYDVIDKKVKKEDVESYVFIVDCSGSMEETDPLGTRFSAIEMLLSQKDDSFEYAVYLFADEPLLVREMLPKSIPMNFSEYENAGGTSIRTTLERVYQDIKSGNVKVSKNTRIVLMTDGYATDIDFFTRRTFINLLDDFYNSGLSISTVGMIEADKDLMDMIAQKTGGTSIDVTDISQLGNAIVEAVKAYILPKRNLLNYREDTGLNVLLGFLRVLFIVLLGMIIAFEKTALCENFLNTNTVLISSVAGGILAGVAIELGMNVFGIRPIVMRIIACILLAFTLIHEDLKRAHAEPDYDTL